MVEDGESGGPLLPSKKRKRSRKGCLNCRKRRKLCDERRPACARCNRMGEQCTWPAPFAFRESGWQGKFEPLADLRPVHEAASNAPPPPKSIGVPSSEQQHPGQGALSYGSSDISTLARTLSATSAPATSIQTPTAGIDAMPRPASGLPPSLLESPDAFVGYYPNAEYRELHATLYDAMVDTVRDSREVTRQTTPERSQPPSRPFQLDHILQRPRPKRPCTRYVLPHGITPARERELWASYLYEITLWLDMFDNENHFRIHIPMMAQSSQALRLSVLALAARQLERRETSKPYLESLALYQEAIHLITQELRYMETPLIASCVLLCVLEMMSSSPRDWARHLEGCASLIKAAGIDGTVGGIEQAVFWCFARMDMWGSFLTATTLRIPTSLWLFPLEPIPTLHRLKQSSSAFDQYANLAVFLCASALNVLSRQEKPSKEPYPDRWRGMFDLLETWYSERPSEMLPILYSPESESKDKFPTILFTNPCAISGNQMYHAAALMMLQSKPVDVKLCSHKSLFWHARHIIGITASNPSHAAYTNAPQPLWIAGRILSHADEHHTVLRLLKVIEEETGFATAWRAEDLKNHWGELG